MEYQGPVHLVPLVDLFVYLFVYLFIYLFVCHSLICILCTYIMVLVIFPSHYRVKQSYSDLKSSVMYFQSITDPYGEASNTDVFCSQLDSTVHRECESVVMYMYLYMCACVWVSCVHV